MTGEEVRGAASVPVHPKGVHSRVEVRANLAFMLEKVWAAWFKWSAIVTLQRTEMISTTVCFQRCVLAWRTNDRVIVNFSHTENKNSMVNRYQMLFWHKHRQATTFLTFKYSKRDTTQQLMSINSQKQILNSKSNVASDHRTRCICSHRVTSLISNRQRRTFPYKRRNWDHAFHRSLTKTNQKSAN